MGCGEAARISAEPVGARHHNVETRRRRVAILFPETAGPAAPALFMIDASAQFGVKARAASLPVVASVRAFRLDAELGAGRATARAGCGSAPGWSSLLTTHLPAYVQDTKLL